jgi:thiamine transporter
VLIAAAGRYGSHLVSGAVFFGEYAPDGQPVWVYSALYNLYVPVSAALAFVGASAVLPVLSKAAPTPAVTREARA